MRGTCRDSTGVAVLEEKDRAMGDARAMHLSHARRNSTLAKGCLLSRDGSADTRARISSSPMKPIGISIAEESSADQKNHTDQTREATVPDGQVQESMNEEVCNRETATAEILRRRKTNREHMRRRRADPVHSAREKEKRGSARTATRGSNESFSASVAQPMGRICAMCHLRAAVEEISRLEPSTFARGGYVQVRLPYCGRC